MDDFDLGLNALEYEVWVGDDSIGGAQLTKTAKIVKNGISYIDVPITFRLKEFGSAVWDIIIGKGTGYAMKGNLDVDTPFGGMKLPISKEGGTTCLKTTKEDRCDDDDDDVFLLPIFVLHVLQEIASLFSSVFGEKLCILKQASFLGNCIGGEFKLVRMMVKLKLCADHMSQPSRAVLIFCRGTLWTAISLHIFLDSRMCLGSF